MLKYVNNFEKIGRWSKVYFFIMFLLPSSSCNIKTVQFLL